MNTETQRHREINIEEMTKFTESVLFFVNLVFSKKIKLCASVFDFSNKNVFCSRSFLYVCTLLSDT